jgi:hypothetical protein
MACFGSFQPNILHNSNTCILGASHVAAVWRASWNVKPSSFARTRALRNNASSVEADIPNTSTGSKPSIFLMSLDVLTVKGTSLEVVLVTGNRQCHSNVLSHGRPHNSPALMPVRRATKNATAHACVMLLTGFRGEYLRLLSIILISRQDMTTSLCSGSLGRLTSLTGLTLIHFHSRLAVSNTDESKVKSLITDPGLTTFNRSSRQIPNISGVILCNGELMGSELLSSACILMASFTPPRFCGETSSEYRLSMSPKVNRSSGGVLILLSISASLCVAQRFASRVLDAGQKVCESLTPWRYICTRKPSLYGTIEAMGNTVGSIWVKVTLLVFHHPCKFNWSKIDNYLNLNNSALWNKNDESSVVPGGGDSILRQSRIAENRGGFLRERMENDTRTE